MGKIKLLQGAHSGEVAVDNLAGKFVSGELKVLQSSEPIERGKVAFEAVVHGAKASKNGQFREGVDVDGATESPVVEIEAMDGTIGANDAFPSGVPPHAGRNGGVPGGDHVGVV